MSADDSLSVDPEIEILYDPIRWRCPFGCVPIDSNHNARKKLIELMRYQTEQCRQNTIDVGFRELNIAYGITGDSVEGNEAFDLYCPVAIDGDECHVLIYLHGGFWRSLDLAESSHWASCITKAGAIFVALCYRLTPYQSVESMADRLCVGLSRIYYHVSQAVNKLCHRSVKISFHLVGHSAGAHLAVETAMHALEHPEESSVWLPLLKSLILVSGLYDLRPLLHTSFNITLRFNSEEEAWQVSPFRHFEQYLNFSNLAVKWLISWAEYDPPGFIQQAKDFLQCLQESSVAKVESFVVRDEDHLSTVEKLYYGPKQSKLVQKILQFIFT